MNVRHVVHGNQSEDQFVRGARKICEVVVFFYSDNVVRISLPRKKLFHGCRFPTDLLDSASGFCRRDLITSRRQAVRGLQTVFILRLLILDNNIRG